MGDKGVPSRDDRVEEQLEDDTLLSLDPWTRFEFDVDEAKTEAGKNDPANTLVP